MCIQSVSPDTSLVLERATEAARYSFLYGCRACGTVAGRNATHIEMSDEERAFAEEYLAAPDVPRGYHEAGALADYLWRHCRQSFGEVDLRIDGTKINRKKFEFARSHCAKCQERGACGFHREMFRCCRYGDAEIERELRDGWQSFRVRTARQLLERNPDLPINRCSACNAICRTPVAKQCRRCGHDWH
jgi:hypothetical protein